MLHTYLRMYIKVVLSGLPNNTCILTGISTQAAILNVYISYGFLVTTNLPKNYLTKNYLTMCLYSN